MDCERCAELEDQVARLKNKYEGRGKEILNLTYNAIVKRLSEGDFSPNMLNVARQFLRDNGLELAGFDEPSNHIIKNYPFATPAEGDDSVGVRPDDYDLERNAQ